MSTTTLYAELVVVGTGALVFILLFFYALFGDQSWLSKFQPDSIGTAIYLIPVLSVIYLLGIVVANVTHRMFEGLEEQLRENVLCGLDYKHIRNDLYTSGDAQNLVHEFESDGARFEFVAAGT